MLANPYGATTPATAPVTKTTPRGSADNDNAEVPAATKDRRAGRALEPHWDAVIAAATD